MQLVTIVLFIAMHNRAVIHLMSTLTILISTKLL